MKILIVGTGIIGSMLGWQLSINTENHITHYVRNKDKANFIKDNGIKINCLDMRNQRRETIDTVYHPNCIINISNLQENEYDIIIIPIKVNQLAIFLEDFKNIPPAIPFLFMQNMWISDIRQTKVTLGNREILYGQPHIFGGGINNN